MVEAMYVHVPFCNSICAYCDFARSKYNSNLVKKWFKAFELELSLIATNKQLKTIYIGGGTPTSLSGSELEHLLSLLEPYTHECVEYTIEINPETMTPRKVELLKKYHINRVSIGVQTTSDKLLKVIHRSHTTSQVHEVIGMLKDVGIHNISVDCMMALPSQTKEDVLNTLNDLTQMPITHISLYSLTVEENSYFGRYDVIKADEDLENEMYFEAVNFLSKKGFIQYETSNFSKLGFESMHNQVYWHYEDFYGIGLGASGKENHQRYDNTTNFLEYFNHQFRKNVISLTLEEEMFEMVMMNLRLRKGMSISSFESRFKHNLLELFSEGISEGIKREWLILDGDILKCSDIGYPLLNSVLELFM